MYGKYKKRTNFRGKKRMSPTKKAYLAGIRRGKNLAYMRRAYKRRF